MPHNIRHCSEILTVNLRQNVKKESRFPVKTRFSKCVLSCISQYSRFPPARQCLFPALWLTANENGSKSRTDKRRKAMRMEAVKERLRSVNICVMQIKIIVLLFRLLHAVLACTGVNPSAFFYAWAGDCTECFAPFFCRKPEKAAGAGTDCTSVPAPFLFAQSFSSACRSNASSPRQPASTSRSVRAKSPVYQGSATSPGQSV